ncbi:hypothetical protein [Neisseria sp. 74A18]|uniref:hypothetical protein n=1 Tax=Neisseria sp. 74A18 TaxID=1696094 RepID=UPI0006CADFFC|nr:hypothetical protein [Neisseria sp. 74A18]KPN72891.1 hypothetical protein AKG43_10980 [Neisseria sp. 74A18]
MKKLTAAVVALGMSASVFAAGSFNQAVLSGKDAQLVVSTGYANAQGLNVINANDSITKVDQGVLINNLDLELKNAAYTTQGANVVVAGKETKNVDQEAWVNEVKMKTTNGAYNTQGVNVIELK